MSVAGEIGQDRGGAGKRFFRIDHPVGSPQRRQERFKGFLIGERGMLSEKPEAAFGMRFKQQGKDKPPEQLR
jgi:hypothetical protein